MWDSLCVHDGFWEPTSVNFYAIKNLEIGKFLREISLPFIFCVNNFQMVQVNIYMFSRRL